MTDACRRNPDLSQATDSERPGRPVLGLRRTSTLMKPALPLHSEQPEPSDRFAMVFTVICALAGIVLCVAGLHLAFKLY